ADQAQNRESEENSGTQPLSRKRVLAQGADVALRLGYQTIDCRRELPRQIGVLRNELLRIADKIELLAAHRNYRLWPEGERANTRQLLDEQRAQLRIEVLRPCIEIIEPALQLKSDHRKPRLLTQGRGLQQLVDNGGKLTLSGLCRAVEHDQRREITSRRHP